MKELVAELKREGVLRNQNVLRAFQKIDRKDFVPETLWDEAYGNYPLLIGYDQTISQPYTVAFMMDLLEPKPNEKILDVGSGSGWTTALLSAAVGDRGRAFGVEIIPDLVALGQKNLIKYNFPNASIQKAESGVLGLPNEAPFDKILVSAAGRELPTNLLKQLKTGGTLVMPIDNYITRVKKVSTDRVETEKFLGFAFVPLIES